VKHFSSRGRAAFLSLGASFVACSSGGSSTPPDAGVIVIEAGSHKHDSGGHDAAPDSKAEAGDHGAVSTTYPAFTVDMPSIVANQGTVLKSPVIVTVTWPAQDSNAATWEAMGDAIGSSTYWSATTAAYGVGSATSGSSNHVRMTEPLPSSMSYYALADVVSAALGVKADGGVPDAGSADAGDAGANPAWPAPTSAGGNVQTIYALFVPAGVSVVDPGSGMPLCTEGGLGYHDNVTLGSGAPVAYAVTLECSGQTVPDLEETVAHEYVEAATNPYPSTSSLGYVGFDADHLSWALYTGFNDELADACQNWAASYYQESSSFPYWVQRSWSNVHAAAGYDPCAPRAAVAYQGITLFPAQQSTVMVNLTDIGLSTMSTKGFTAQVGQTVTFQVGFYSDASTGPWTIGYDFPSMTQLFNTMGATVTNGAATVTIDKTSGQNGEKANISVTPTTAGPLGFQLMAITWDPPTGAAASMYLPRYAPVIISNK